MNRIVFDHYPVSKLPEDLRGGFAAHDQVRVTIDAPAHDQPTDANGKPAPEPGLFSSSRHLRRRNFASDVEVDANVRSLRDE